MNTLAVIYRSISVLCRYKKVLQKRPLNRRTCYSAEFLFCWRMTFLALAVPRYGVQPCGVVVFASSPCSPNAQHGPHTLLLVWDRTSALCLSVVFPAALRAVGLILTRQVEKTEPSGGTSATHGPCRPRPSHWLAARCRSTKPLFERLQHACRCRKDETSFSSIRDASGGLQRSADSSLALSTWRCPIASL